VSFSPGSRVGPYEISAQIGAGGMGEVYRATDTNLARQVAIKVLPASMAADVERLARFDREARILVALNHPNIAAIYGVEKSDGLTALVMEFVEGPTLADRLARGAIPVDESLGIARQIADALEAAHEQGIVHRDLKPANIKLRPDGTVKVLDFGLAKAEATSARGMDATLSPTITSPALMTGVGVLLGTAAYMSPEQAKGRAADKRSDVWAFGAVLYEMLTGRRAFEGDDVSDTLAAVLRGEPDWSRLPSNTPASIRVLLRRSLEKERRTRLADIADARLEIVEASTAAVLPPQRRHALSAKVGWGLCALAAVAIVALANAYWSRSPVATQTVTFTIAPPDGWTVALDVGGGGAANVPIAVSPDGRQIVMVARNAEGRARLWVRSLDALGSRELPGTDGAVAPFWSPNSQSVAFFADGKLKKINVADGLPVTLCSTTSLNSGAWGTQGVIVFSRAGGGSGGGGALLKVSQSGGVPTQATTLAAGEVLHIRPSFLPDGRHFLFRVTAVGASGGTFVGSLESTERIRLPGDFGNAVYARGRILFVRESTLMAQPFDEQGLALTGEPVPIADQIETSATSIPIGSFSVSQTGVLAYQTGASALGGVQLTWLDRNGKVLGVVGNHARYNDIELSPDGKQALVSIARAEARRDIWLIDLIRDVQTRVTFNDAGAQTSIWSPDGARVVFNVRRGNGSDLLQRPASGGPERPLLTGEGFKVPFSWSPDGRFILYSPRTPAMTIWVLPVSGDGKPFPFFQTTPGKEETFSDTSGSGGEYLVRNYARFSPHGDWVAFVSNESATAQVFVVPFPDATSNRLQVSRSGGREPRWRRDGTEIFYLNEDTLMAAPVSGTGASLQIGTPQQVFRFRNAGMGRSSYDVAPDGQRFLFVTRVEETSSAPITVVVNWDRN
jgi:eukaryotic-like serine/threonine-protein kinase